ncbi:MAG TPA: energy transducer TonB, partial [Methylotenera sp.]|nr:energy transducer TonB [Methylotenera sp.]
MNTSIKNSNGHINFNENTLIWALICSVLLHVLIAVIVPDFKFEIRKDKPQPLTIEIMQPTPPAPVALPEPVVPEPVEPEPIKKEIKPVEPVKPVRKKTPEPAPIEEANPEPATAEPAPPSVITAAPKADVPPVITAPPPEPPKKIEPNENEINNALSQYGSMLGRAIAKHKSYPKIAQMRGWQGECLLDLKIDSNGTVLSANIKESRGHESLDNQALEMVRKASPFPAPREALRGR